MIRHEVLGTIKRNTATGAWYVLVDATHAQYGIASVEVDPDDSRNVRVHFDFEADRVLSAICGPDETLAKATIIPGASCELDYAVISFGKNGAQVSQALLSSAYANTWLNFQLESDEE